MSKRYLYVLLIISLLLILGGNFLAFLVQTDFGGVVIKDVRFMGSNKIQMSGLLYIPKDASRENKKPAVLAIHGYINSRETQDGFAIELARRGYVVLALDQTGHGFSDPPAYANGFGGPDGLSYLRSLDFVDLDNIGLEGHSMGGWSVVIAAAIIPDGYKAMVLEGSSTGTMGAPEGNESFPKNVCVVFSKYDEFSELMWGSTTAQEVGKTEKMKKLFGTDEDIVEGKIYGSIDDGTARVLYQPACTHPWDHFSIKAIGYAIDWFSQTLNGGKAIPSSNQVWYWKEIGNLLALIGMIILVLASGGLLLKSNFFKELEEKTPTIKSATGATWWISAVIFTAVGPLTYFWLKNLTLTKIIPKVTAFFPQEINNGIMGWAVGNGIIALLLFLLWRYVLDKNSGGNGVNFGLTWEREGLSWRKIGKSALLAIAVTFIAYLSLALSDFLFKTDYRIWIFAVKLFTPLKFRIFLQYLIFFLIFFFIYSLVMHGQLRVRSKEGKEVSLSKEILINIVLAILGFFIYLVLQYIPLFRGGTLLTPDPLWVIIGIQFLPILSIAAAVSTFFFRATGHIYTGAFMNSLLITWIIVAGTAVHFPF